VSPIDNMFYTTRRTLARTHAHYMLYYVFVCVSSRNDDLTEGPTILFLDRRRRRRAGGILCERPLVRCTNGSIISSSGRHEYNIKSPKNVFFFFSSSSSIHIIFEPLCLLIVPFTFRKNNSF